jgi:hypothetical protein
MLALHDVLRPPSRCTIASPNETPELFQRMAAGLVALKSDVLVSVGNVASPYARNATETNTPTRGLLLAFCARAASGHAAAAPPMSVMNSRRVIQSPRRRGRAAGVGR